MATTRWCVAWGWIGLLLIASGCAPIRWTSPGEGDAAHPDAGSGPGTELDGGALGRRGDVAMDDAGRLIDDAAMAMPDADAEPFTFEPTEPRVVVRAGDRAVLPVRVVRAAGVLAWIELHAQGLPRGVAALYAIGPDPTEIALILEASDTTSPVMDLPFTLEANAAGVRRSRRILLTVLPEAAVPEE